MRILTVAGWISPDIEGGSFRVVFELARSLAARGNDVHVLTQAVGGKGELHETIEGVRVHRYRTWAPSGLRFYASSILGVWRMVNEMHAAEPFDVLHLHHPVSALGATLSGAGRKLPALHTFHVPYFLEHAFNRGLPADRPGPICAALRWIDYHNLKCSRQIVVLSDFTLRRIEEYYPDCATRAKVIPAGVDLEAFKRTVTKREAREQLGLNPDTALLVSVRRLEPRMGLENLINAMPMLKARHPNARLIIVGRGSLHESLTERIRRLDLDETVTLAGFVPESQLPLYYQAPDCFVIPTVALEGFGMVTVEALACGTPVLGTPAGATPELLGRLDPELVMKSAEPADMADAVAAFLGRDDLDDWGERCRRYAEEHYDWNDIARQYEAEFERILSRNS